MLSGDLPEQEEECEEEEEEVGMTMQTHVKEMFYYQFKFTSVFIICVLFSNLLIYSFICLFVYLFICSFIYSFICLFIYCFSL